MELPQFGAQETIVPQFPIPRRQDPGFARIRDITQEG
jgi:hypothetical protein